MEKITRTIKAVSTKRIDSGNIGFLTTFEEENWFNISGETEALQEIAKNIVCKGNKVEFEHSSGIVGNITLIEKAQEKDKNWAEDMTNYEDLLNAAHEKAKEDGFYISIRSEPLRNFEGEPLVNFKEKTALYQATLEIKDSEGRTIQTIIDTGDAEGITNDKIKPHFNRMASTRAMARCYRIYTNNAKVAVEETDIDSIPEEKILKELHRA